MLPAPAPQVKAKPRPARLLFLSHPHIVAAAGFIYLVQKIQLTRGNFSLHLRKLEDAGYVAIDKKREDRAPKGPVAGLTIECEEIAK